MVKKMLMKDLKRNKIITATLFAFIMLAAILVASATNIISELTGGMDSLFTQTKAPHFVQMHTGPIQQKQIDEFTKKNQLVAQQQTQELLNIDGSAILLGKAKKAETESVMDVGFVTQNKSFDYLLTLNNKVAQVKPNQIAIPIYYHQKNNLEIGDPVTIKQGQFTMKFIISDFIRDVQMNPSLIHSKRFLVNTQDYNKLKGNLGENEYMIEYLLKDSSKTSEFEKNYQATTLPQKGIAITGSLFQTINALNDGLVALVIILVSILLIVIALLCLRYTLISTIEEDYREIGIMKAIGLKSKNIKKLYLMKYVTLAATACLVGLVIAQFVSQVFTANITLYFGKADKTIITYLLPFIGISIIFIIVVLFSRLILRRFNKVSAVEAIRVARSGSSSKSSKLVSLNKNKKLNINILLGLKDVVNNLRTYLLLGLIFIVSSFIIIVPTNLLTTIESDNFISYMGSGKSDIRIDLQQTDDITKSFNQINNKILKDKDIAKYSPLVTSQFKTPNSEGTTDNINIESGNFEDFPLDYTEGKAPSNASEIALSGNNAQELDKKLGDKIKIIINKDIKQLVVIGIYQDITNGGKTAKSSNLVNTESILRYTLNINVKPNVNIAKKRITYSKDFSEARVTDVTSYLKQTLGNTITQFKMITTLIIIISTTLAILITALFLKMLISKDSTQIAILKSLGFSAKDLKIQYLTRTLIVLAFGIIIGTVGANTLGQTMISSAGAMAGASNIQFVINPFLAYLLCPLLLISSVLITATISCKSLKNKCDISLIAE